MVVEMKPYTLAKSMILSLQQQLSRFAPKIDPELRIHAGELYCALSKLLSWYAPSVYQNEAGVGYQNQDRYQISLNTMDITMQYASDQKAEIIYQFMYQIGLYRVSEGEDRRILRSNLCEITIQFSYPIYATEEEQIGAMDRVVQTAIAKINSLLEVQHSLVDISNAVVSVPYYKQKENPYVN